MAQLMPLPLTVSCFRKIQIGFTFLVPAHPGSPGIKAVTCIYTVAVQEQLQIFEPDLIRHSTVSEEYQHCYHNYHQIIITVFRYEHEIITWVSTNVTFRPQAANTTTS